MTQPPNAGQDPNEQYGSSGYGAGSSGGSYEPYSQAYGQSQPSASDPYAQPYSQSQPSASDPYAQPYSQSQPSASDPYAQPTASDPYGQASASDPYGQQGYAQQGYGQQGYPVQPYGQGMMLPDHPQSTTVLVLGILGFVVAVTGPFAWYIGSKARKEIRQNPGSYREGGMLTVGWILGIISTGYLALIAVILVIYVIAIIALVAGTAGSY